MSDTGHDISTRAGLAAYRAASRAPKPRELAKVNVRAGRLSLTLAARIA